MALRESSSSFSYGFTYDVFLSFRGLDTRYGFTGNLYKALSDKGIHTFIDHEELQRGHEITPSLLEAIEESRIAIIVLSKNYASSSFCLHELVKILDCIKGKGRLVWPIFYDVDPSHVRKQTGSYGEALAMLAERFNDNNLQIWKNALQQVANLSGWHFKIGDGYEYEFIGNIVEHVSNKMNRVPLPVADYPVGLEPQVLEINSLLDIGSDDEVNMIGIHGSGGIGKTTLALAVYNLIADHFEALCFLENARENSYKHGLQHLQKILLSETLGEKEIKLTSVKQGISIIKHRLRQKKVLLILDDVDKVEQLEALVGGSDWFGSGSRVIITTRDKHLLSNHGVKRTYEVNVLNEKDALRLLTWKAFKTEKFHPSYFDVLKRAVGYASGLPLALIVIGSNLFGKSIQEWESALHRYEIIPNKEIQNILKVSFDALEEDEKSVFLDMACIYIGKEYHLANMENMLYAHYDACMKYHIGVLVEKSLIKISWTGQFTVHDLIGDMAKEIVRMESPDEPGKRSRLWFHEDIIQVLEDNSGTSAIKSIYLMECDDEVELDESAFKKMKNLKTLIIRGGHFSKGPKHLPNSLRVVEWWNYPSEYFPYDFNPKKLAIFELPKSSLMSLKLTDLMKKFLNMKILNFDEADFLTEIPDASSLLNLEKISFESCRNLTTIHESVGFLEKLKVLSAQGCRKLRRFPPIKLISLEELNLSFCTNLESFPEILGKMENMKNLVLEETSLKELPNSFQNLTHLQTLQLRCCGVFKLPSCILTMPKLVEIIGWVSEGWQFPKSDEAEDKVSSMVSSNVESLRLAFCNLSDEFVPIILTWFVNVKELYLAHNNFTILPECIKDCHLLRELCVDECHYLQEVRGIAPNLKILYARGCKSWTCTEMFMNQEVHEAGGTMFYLPGSRIPDWFEHCSSGGSISFWIRNKFPAIALCLVPSSIFVKSTIYPIVIINGNECKLDSRDRFPHLSVEPDHTYIFDLQTIKFEDNLDEALLEDEWNHMEIMYQGENNARVPIESGIHVFEQKCITDDIRFTDPRRMILLDDDFKD